MRLILDNIGQMQLFPDPHVYPQSQDCMKQSQKEQQSQRHQVRRTEHEMSIQVEAAAPTPGHIFKLR